MTEAKAAELVASTVNEQLLNRAIRHQIYIQQYGSGVAEDIVKELAQAEQELLGKVAARLVKAEKIGFDRGPWTTKRLSTITAGLGEIVDNKYSATYKDMLKPKMLELAKAEADFTVGGFDSTVPVKLEYELPSPQMLRSMVLSEPFEGAVMGKWWKGVATGEKEQIQRALRQGLVQGETTAQIVRRLSGPKGVLDIARHHATAVIRTATNHVSSGARAQTYQQNSKYIKSEKIVATLDSRTSEICRFQDGRVYPVGEGPRPPFHFNCRTTVIAVLKSWKEMGIPLKEAPAGTRASMNGQVPADLTYKQWFKAQPPGFKRELLGPSRYKMYASGLEDVTKFATPAGKIYNLKQLYSRHPDVALKAKLIEPGQASAALKRQAQKQFDKALDSAVKGLKVPAEASSYSSFLTAYKAAKATISEAAVKAQANGLLAGAKTFEALDKLKDISKVYKAKIETDNTAVQLIEIAKATGIKKWQWSTKDNLATLMTSIDDDLIDAATTQMNDKWLGWKAKQAANKAAKKADVVAIKEATEAVAEIQDSVQIPDSPAGWEQFKESVVAVNVKMNDQTVKLLAAKVSPEKINTILGPFFSELQVKKDAFKSMVSALKHNELATLGKDTGIKKWQWTKKDEFIALMTSNDATELADVAKSVEAKWLGWKAKQKVNQEAKKVIKDKLKVDAKELQAAVKAAGGKALLKDVKVYLGSLEATDDPLVGNFATAMWKVADPDPIKDKLKSMGYKWQNMPEASPTKVPPAQAAKELVAMDDFPVAQANSFDWEDMISALDNPQTLAHHSIDAALDLGLDAASNPLLVAKIKQKLAGMGYKWNEPDFDFDAAAVVTTAPPVVPAPGPLSQYDEFVGSLKVTNEALDANKSLYPESLHSLGDWDKSTFDNMVEQLQLPPNAAFGFSDATDFGNYLTNIHKIHPDLHPVIAHALTKAGVISGSGPGMPVSILGEISQIHGKPKQFLSGPKLKEFVIQVDKFDAAAPPVAKVTPTVAKVAPTAGEIDLPDTIEGMPIYKKFTYGKAAINDLASMVNYDKFGDAGVWTKSLMNQTIAKLKDGSIKTDLDLSNWIEVSHGAGKTFTPLIAHAMKEAGLKHPAIKALARKAVKGNSAYAKKVSSAVATSPTPSPSPAVTPPPAPVAATAQASPTTVATAAKPKPTTGWDAVDDAWEQIKPDDFKYLGDASGLGGAHSKDFYELDGEKWLFKPVSKGGWASGDAFIARGEEAVYRLQRLVDPQTPEVRVIELNGRVGSIQKILPNIDKDFNGIMPRELTADLIEQFQREHVVDWLSSNHDGHWKQFLLDPDGHVYGIDKGQAYKFLDSDKLDLTYAPNSHLGEREPYYNEIFRAAKAGEVNFDPQATLKYIQRIEELDDNTFREILRPYAEGRFKKKTEAERFIDLALDRKHNLRTDFRDYYRNVTNDPDFDWEVSPTDIGMAEGRIVDGLEAQGWQGQTIPFDGDQVEDQNLLLFVDEVRKYKKADKAFVMETRTTARLKLRPDADEKVLDFIRDNGGAQIVAKVKAKPIKIVGEVVPEDEFGNSIKSAVITVKSHNKPGDYKYNTETLDKAYAHELKLTQLANSADPDVQDMANEYLQVIADVKTAVATPGSPLPIKGDPDGFFEHYRATRPPAPPKAKAPSGSVQVESSEITLSARSLDDEGRLSGQGDRAPNFVSGGKQYNIEFPDGTKAYYRPWDNDVPYSQRGELEIEIADRPSKRSVEEIIKKLDSMNLDARIASVEDTEMMYLMKQAYITRKDESVDWTTMMRDLESRNATATERVASMRGYWEKELKVKDLTKMPDYNPEGWYERSALLWRNNKDISGTGGNRYQYRFDLPEDFATKARGGMKDYTLRHEIYGGDVAGFFEIALPKNGALISSNEKMRLGIPLGGKSPEADMRTGGARYSFTRIFKRSSKHAKEAGVYFKTRNLRRMDAISYTTDMFGDVGGDGGANFVRENRGSTVAAWKRFSKISDNETIFKNGLSLIEEVEKVIAGGAQARARIIKA